MLKNYDEATTLNDPNRIEDEVERLLALKSYHILDTDKEVEFEEMTKEAKDYFGVPIAVISLVDLGRQWFKSVQGLETDSTPRCLAFCSHLVKREQPGCMVVHDAAQDDRFKDNPLVTGGPQVRFYAGAPLITPEGKRIGSFCIIDFKPHPEGLTTTQRDRLELFAREAMFQMITRM